jgi:hypothetical protein
MDAVHGHQAGAVAVTGRTLHLAATRAAIRSEERVMMEHESSLSVVGEAQQALQVANALHHIHDRFEQGGWTRGQRSGPNGRSCIVGAIDEATRWTMAGVEQAIIRELVADLPAPLRVLARVSPRAALMTYNDAPGGERRIHELVVHALRRLGMGSTLPPMAPRRGALKPSR